nr:carboxypeptidase-like regulatory domain-containing protein [Niabella hibiscisoli]
MLLYCSFIQSAAQLSSIKGKVISNDVGESWVNLNLENTNWATATDSAGNFSLDSIVPGQYKLSASHLNYEPYAKEITLRSGESLTVNIDLSAFAKSGTLKDVVISGTMKAVNRLESPVPVEVYTPAYFKKSNAQHIRCVTEHQWGKATAQLQYLQYG